MQVAWDPAVHLTRADLYFEGHGDNARAVIMTRAVRLGVSARGVPERSPAEYQAPRLGGTTHRSWAKVPSAAARCPCGGPATHRSRAQPLAPGCPLGLGGEPLPHWCGCRREDCGGALVAAQQFQRPAF